MSVRISAGTYVAVKKPAAAMGWWIGRVSKTFKNGFCEVEIRHSENPPAAKFICVTNGKSAKDQCVVGFHTFKEAYRFLRRKKRAFEYRLALEK